MKAPATFAAALTTAALVSSCGGTSGLIPSKNAANLQTDLTNVSVAVTLQECTQTRRALNSAYTDLAALPPSVNQSLVRNITVGLNRLDSAANRECRPATTNTGPSGTTGATSATGTTGASSPTGASGTTGASGASGATGSTTTSSTSSAATTTSSTATTTSSTTTTSSAATTTGGTGATTGTGGGTPAGGTTGTTTSTSNGIGGSGGAVSGN